MFRGFGGGFPDPKPPFKVTSAVWSLYFAQKYPWYVKISYAPPENKKGLPGSFFTAKNLPLNFLAPKFPKGSRRVFQPSIFFGGRAVKLRGCMLKSDTIHRKQTCFLKKKWWLVPIVLASFWTFARFFGGDIRVRSFSGRGVAKYHKHAKFKQPTVIKRFLFTVREEFVQKGWKIFGWNHLQQILQGC